MNKIILLLIIVSSMSCYKEADNTIKIFYASGLSPLINVIQKQSIKENIFKIIPEPSGSHLVCRKVTELKKYCDLMIVADNTLFKQISSNDCNFRIDFAHDELALAVGIRAKQIDRAEKNWIQVILDNNIITGLVDENLAPTGNYTKILLQEIEVLQKNKVWELFKNKSLKTFNDATELAASLKSGNTEYGFLFKTTCIQYDIRFIDLSKENLRINKIPITYSLSIPKCSKTLDLNLKFLKYFFNQAEIFTNYGFILFKPKFFGPKNIYKDFTDIAEYAGEF